MVRREMNRKSHGNDHEQGLGSEVPSTGYFDRAPGAFHGSFEMQPCRPKSLSHAPSFDLAHMALLGRPRSQFGVGASLP